MNNDRFDALWHKFHIIYQVGDLDEMSLKHLGHGVAAILAFDSWLETADYGYPSPYEDWQDKEKHDFLENQWNVIQALIFAEGKQSFIDAIPQFRSHPYLMYIGNYINESWLPYQSAIIKQGLKLRED